MATEPSPPAAGRARTAAPAVEQATYRHCVITHDTLDMGVHLMGHHHMYARPRCRRRGIRWESGTVPQRCGSALDRPDTGSGVRSCSPRTCRWYVRTAMGAGVDTSGPRGLGRWTPRGVPAHP
ncbi:hypothetical protein Scani_09740 [Streptomyces caniferus]|uniref:Uncharacterized protein n=1 Tax=Streptomyces caniferus TaxID=285557 RepID=A0A640S2P3_9ACTN|nr:hypothetical protein Scani_09740 [Streptomyces caniferus]